jgi:hypothetical protein
LSILKIMPNASFFDALVQVVAEAAPWLLFGFAAAGLLRALIPEEKVYALLGRDSLRSVTLASLFGVPLPLCSCSVIPAATGLRRSGAGRAATTSFLISTPETGVDSISLTYALMDPIMTVARPVAAFVTALLTGAAVALLPAEDTTGELPAAAASSCCSAADCDAPAATAERTRTAAVRDGLRYAFGPLVDDLAVWLIVGFLLAAGVAATVPDDFFAALPTGWVSSLLMMLIATPVYICASAATPIAAALVMKGLDPGAALVFLLVGPATNVTTILVVARFLGRRVLAVYLLGVTSCALAFGAGVNALYGALRIDPVAVVREAEHGGIGGLQALAAIVLTALLLYRLALRVWAPPTAGSEPGVSTVLR